MTLRVPAKVDFVAPGRKRWTAKVAVLSLPDFSKAWGEREGDELPVAFWDSFKQTVVLRADRREDLRFLDFKHEIQHAFIDWLDDTFVDPREHEKAS